MYCKVIIKNNKYGNLSVKYFEKNKEINIPLELRFTNRGYLMTPTKNINFFWKLREKLKNEHGIILTKLINNCSLEKGEEKTVFSSKPKGSSKGSDAYDAKGQGYDRSTGSYT